MGGSVPVARAKVSILCSVRCMGRISFQIELGLGYNVRESARLRFSVKVWCA